ncbi:MAG TPA: serine/threonine-protein kinase [Gemmatimonadales bacterium]|nr:serine/threonine-protein kinase [Gemmatimonadales bacterium]
MKICPVCSTEFPNDQKFCPNDGSVLRGAAPTSDLVGQVIAERYHVVKKLGEGGMGQVYLAEHVKMGRRSAIKVMNPSMTHDPDAVARFNREAANASRITHPNVCAVYDFGETPDGLIYLAMEFIQGEPLTDLIEREGALKVGRAVKIFQQTADALQAAHDLGIVHRDLKPDNIMLAKGRDGADVVKVVDFGIAKAVGGDEAGQKVTKTGLVVGTPEFMSPEQLSGDKVDGRSDLYSLALVLYRMLTGTLPFQATSVQETMIKRLTDEPTKLAVSRPDLTFPPKLQGVLDHALTRTPNERYQSVAEFSADVVKAVGGGTAALAMDTEGRTQVMGAAAADDKTRIAAAVPATRVAGATKEKKSMMVPMAIGVVVIALGGGAWAVFGRGHNTPPLNALSQHDSAVHQTAAVPTGRDTTHMSRPDTTNKTTPKDPNPGGHSTPNTSPTASAVNPAKAFDALDDLFNHFQDSSVSTKVAEDSATDVYNASTVTPKDRAYAAYILANVYARNHDTRATQWAQKAQQLDPANNAYRQLVHDLTAAQ